jgi:hypothetical protein
MSKYTKENRILKKLHKYCLDKEAEANKDKLTDVGEAYHDIIHKIIELSKEE